MYAFGTYSRTAQAEVFTTQFSASGGRPSPAGTLPSTALMCQAPFTESIMSTQNVIGTQMMRKIVSVFGPSLWNQYFADARKAIGAAALLFFHTSMQLRTG
eukprot:4265646-Alexandrium_andersonii.AAC.1